MAGFRKTLTPKQTAFAEKYVTEYMRGKCTLVELYRNAGYKASTNDIARVEAWELLHNERVLAYIKSLQEELQKNSPITRANLVNDLYEIAQEFKRASVIEDEDGKRVDPQSANVVIKSVQQISQMMGLNEPEKTETKIKVDFGGDSVTKDDIDRWMK